jgi:hypothetical protein
VTRSAFAAGARRRFQRIDENAAARADPSDASPRRSPSAAVAGRVTGSTTSDDSRPATIAPVAEPASATARRRPIPRAR